MGLTLKDLSGLIEAGQISKFNGRLKHSELLNLIEVLYNGGYRAVDIKCILKVSASAVSFALRELRANNRIDKKEEAVLEEVIVLD